jgi:hypothetical protein
LQHQLAACSEPTHLIEAADLDPQIELAKEERVLSHEHSKFEFSLHDRATTSLKSSMTGFGDTGAYIHPQGYLTESEN